MGRCFQINPSEESAEVRACTRALLEAKLETENRPREDDDGMYVYQVPVQYPVQYPVVRDTVHKYPVESDDTVRKR